jgi:Arylsulfotransferase (ASST)
LLTAGKRLGALVSLVWIPIAPTAAHAAGVIVSPLPGTPTATAQTQISFLGANRGSLVSVTVVGSRSGRHGGRLRYYSSAAGASFVPRTPFLADEHVSVHARWRSARHTVRLTTHFKIAQPVAVPSGELPSTAGTAADVQSFHTLPELHPPKVTVNQPAGAASAPGYVFATPYLGPGQHGPMIFDNAGNLVWFRTLSGTQHAADLQTQVFHDKNNLTWWQGKTIIDGYGLGEDVIANANYKTVAVVKAGNGLAADEHEFLVTPNGSAIVTAYDPVRQNLAGVGGASSGIAVDCVAQEIDIHTGLVMWEWHSLGHVDIAQSYSTAPASPDGQFDYFHLDSIQLLHEGNLLIGARNTWAAYEISARTGQIIWQLGGKRSTFALGAGVPFAYQHDVRLLAGGEVSLFDDEGAPAVSPPSRGELIKLDAKTHTATLVSQLVRTIGPPDTAGQGDMQALANGGWMIGWGGLPNLTEYDAHGQIVYDAQLPAGENSYRVYREPWAAQPSDPPDLAAGTSGATTTVYASWNGATTVASWQLLSGSSSAHLSVVSSTPRSGFETTLTTTAAAFVQVRALSASGKVIGTSKPIAPAAG